MKHVSDIAEAIAEVALYKRPHPVPHKSVEQQDIQSLIRMRRLLVTERTRVVNQVRGLISEYGIIMPKGAAAFRKAIPEILENDENKLSCILENCYHISTNDIYTSTNK